LFKAGRLRVRVSRGSPGVGIEVGPPSAGPLFRTSDQRPVYAGVESRNSKQDRAVVGPD